MPSENVTQQYAEAAGPVGCDMAEQILGNLIPAIDGFPAPPVQRGAILRLVAARLTAHADDIGG